MVADCGQQSCRDETITPVVSRTGDDHDPCAPWKPLRNAVGNRPPGVLHQCDPGHAARVADAIGVCHLGRGEKLDHDQQVSGDPDFSPTRSSHAIVLCLKYGQYGYFVGKYNGAPANGVACACAIAR
jgi:hypothetical protein